MNKTYNIMHEAYMNIFKRLGIKIIPTISDNGTMGGKVYIGSTTDSFRSRWKNHKKLLKKGTHCNKHLQSAYNKYGKSNLVFQIIEITQPENAREREGYYIKLYNSINPKYGYNQAEVDLSGKTKMSESTKKKLSNITKNQWK